MNVKIYEEKSIPILKRIDNYYNNLIKVDTLKTLQKLPDESINLIVTSPPYYLKKEYEKDYSYEEYLYEQKCIIEECYRVLADDGSIYWNVAQTPVNNEIIPLGVIFYNIFKSNQMRKKGINYYLKNWIIWRFNGGVNCKKRLTGRYENVLWFVKNKKKYTFNLDDIRIESKWQSDPRCNPLGKNPTDVWDIDVTKGDIKYFIYDLLKKDSKWTQKNIISDINWDMLDGEEISSFIPQIWEINRVVNNSKERTSHPAQFPEELVRRIVKASSNPGDVVLDIFNGSGTTCKVAEELNRNWLGIDKEEEYCIIAKDRIEKYANEVTIAETGS